MRKLEKSELKTIVKELFCNSKSIQFKCRHPEHRDYELLNIDIENKEISNPDKLDGCKCFSNRKVCKYLEIKFRTSDSLIGEVFFSKDNNKNVCYLILYHNNSVTKKEDKNKLNSNRVNYAINPGEVYNVFKNFVKNYLLKK